MKPKVLADLLPEEQAWLDAYVDGSIEPEAFAALEARTEQCTSFRRIVRRYLALHHSLESASTAGNSSGEPWLVAEQAGAAPPGPELAASGPLPAPRSVFGARLPLLAVALLAFVFGLILMHLTRPSGDGGPTVGATGLSDPKQASARGFAVVARSMDTVWSAGDRALRPGDLLGAESLQLNAGTVEIQFFSGASMAIDGPAHIAVKSAWEAVCHEGAVRMQVPPAARGFKLRSPSTRIVDLGTEFGLVVRDGQGHVEVFDGEILVAHKGAASTALKQGGAADLPNDGPMTLEKAGRIRFPELSHSEGDQNEHARADFERWQTHRDRLAIDDRLIAYYTFDQGTRSAHVSNLASSANLESAGTVILAEPVAGRWPGMKQALEFRRPGARVRVNLAGEFPAFSFACWVRIDSLDRWYNALFMGDGYETGEPHWQIRNDGKMILSVMVDDTIPNPGSPNDAGLHRLYFSPSMWDISKSGQWLHLASVFDPQNRRVSHYVNGNRISREAIKDRFFIDKLRIGNGEVGNWGQPFREEPTWGIRNLNGRMGELAIFKAALDDTEIERLYRQSRADRR